MKCGRVMVKKKGSRERLCKCENPITPFREQINQSPWKEYGYSKNN